MNRHPNLATLLAASMLSATAFSHAADPDLTRRIVAQDGWTTWRVPMIDGIGSPCCFEWNAGHRDVHATACDLDGRSWNIGSRDDEPRPAGPQDLDVYVHVSNGHVDKTRAFGATCSVRNADRLRHLDPVTGAESIAALAAAAADAPGEDSLDGAVAAIALHAAAEATTRLDAMAAAGQPRKLREQSLFWLGQARGADGARIVEKVATGGDDDELRANAVFDLSQSHGVDAYAMIRRIAGSDRSEHVREQSLFWMAQMKDPRARDDILAAIAGDKSEHVREQAVFALSQLEDGQADAALIALIRGDYPHKVKEQALFWLGQSGSPSALAFIDEVLSRKDGTTTRR